MMLSPTTVPATSPFKGVPIKSPIPAPHSGICCRKPELPEPREQPVRLDRPAPQAQREQWDYRGRPEPRDRSAPLAQPAPPEPRDRPARKAQRERWDRGTDRSHGTDRPRWATGATGPQGPAGTTGATGATGPGTNRCNGARGTELAGNVERLDRLCGERRGCL